MQVSKSNCLWKLFISADNVHFHLYSACLHNSIKVPLNTVADAAIRRTEEIFTLVFGCICTGPMADSRDAVPPEEYGCPLCADVLRDPVTIPCGDTYCLECIKIYWDQADHLGVYSCPQCRATFTPRPVLRRNVPNVTHDCYQLPQLTPFPFPQRDSLCDFCIGRKSKAVKSCLMCLAYYCETHIKPHYESSTFKKHKLVDETGHLERKICPQHEKGLELFCRSDQMCICVLCTVREHRNHNIVSADEERAEKQVSAVGNF